jgi:phage baseplate assembly protein V
MRLTNALKMHAAAMDGTAPQAKWGIVQTVDAASMTAKVLLQPEGVPTDWLPILSSFVGGGWGLVHVPASGTQVLCLPDAGDHDNYVIIGATWSTANRPPASAQGEFWLVHSTGSKVALTNDGKAMIVDQAGTSLTFTNDGKVVLNGDLHVTGEVIRGFGSGDQVTLGQHTHRENGTGGGTTNPPNAGT